MLTHITIKNFGIRERIFSHCFPPFLSDLTTFYSSDMTENKSNFNLAPILYSSLEWDSPHPSSAF